MMRPLVGLFLQDYSSAHQEVITGKAPFHGESDLVVHSGVAFRNMLPECPTGFCSVDESRENMLWELMMLCWNQDPMAHPSSASI
jgi:hypothetical protein